MENSYVKAGPHPKLVETLFVFRQKISTVFSDVLGLYEIDHIAVTRLDCRYKILALSSTPAMEFNLFSGGNLWRFDNTWNPHWFTRCSPTSWQSLYEPGRYDELYYLRQVKHQLPLGLSLADRAGNSHYIYSIASHKSCNKTQILFANHHEEFYKIGQYCSNLLDPLFRQQDESFVVQSG